MQPWFIASFDIGRPCYGQLTPVKTRYALTSITWPYRRLKCWAHRGNVFFRSWPLTKSWFSIRSRAHFRLTCCKRGVTVICLSPWYVYPRTHITSDSSGADHRWSQYSALQWRSCYSDLEYIWSTTPYVLKIWVVYQRNLLSLVICVSPVGIQKTLIRAWAFNEQNGGSVARFQRAL